MKKIKKVIFTADKETMKTKCFAIYTDGTREEVNTERQDVMDWFKEEELHPGEEE